MVNGIYYETQRPIIFAAFTPKEITDRQFLILW